MKKVFTGLSTDVDIEDGGCAKILHLADDGHEGMFVRLQSWSEDGDHADLDQFVGKKVKVTVEVVA